MMRVRGRRLPAGRCVPGPFLLARSHARDSEHQKLQRSQWQRLYCATQIRFSEQCRDQAGRIRSRSHRDCHSITGDGRCERTVRDGHVLPAPNCNPPEKDQPEPLGLRQPRWSLVWSTMTPIPLGPVRIAAIALTLLQCQRPDHSGWSKLWRLLQPGLRC